MGLTKHDGSPAGNSSGVISKNLRSLFAGEQGLGALRRVAS